MFLSSPQVDILLLLLWLLLALFYKFVRWLFDFVDVALESRCRHPSSSAPASSSIADAPTFHDIALARLQG
jgi:hypothetical protein